MKQVKSLFYIKLIMIILILIKSTTSWKDEIMNGNNNNIDLVPDFLTLLDEQQKICNNNNNVDDNTNKECQYLMSENIKDYSIKRKLIESSNLPFKYLMNNSQESDKTSCSCGMDYRFADLGYNYFPRYIQTGICKKDGCRSKYSKCSPKTYRVYVLKRREPDDEVQNDTKGIHLSIPYSLKNSWTVETVKVNVTCHCSYS